MMCRNSANIRCVLEVQTNERERLGMGVVTQISSVPVFSPSRIVFERISKSSAEKGALE